MVEVEKVTNPETADEMADSIRRMASEMPVAQEELAGVAAQAGRFGVEGTENMEQFTESVTRMSVATDLSTQQAGEAFARMSTLLDEPVDRVEHLGSAVNELSNTMATSSSEITNATTRSAGALSQLGVGTEDVLALNAAMNEVSASSRIAGTRLRRMGQELQAADAGAMSEALGMSAAEFERMRDESPEQLIQRMAQAFADGGEQAEALRGELSTTSRAALAGLAQNLDSLETAQGAASEQMEEATSLQEEYDAASDTLNAKLQITKNRIRNVGLAIGNWLLPGVTEAVEALNRGLGALTSFGGSAGEAGTAASAFGRAVDVVASIVGRAMRVIGQVVGRVTAAIGQVWARHGSKLKRETRATMDAIQGYIDVVLGALRTAWSMWGDEIMVVVQAGWQNIKTVIQGAVDSILSLVRVVLALIRGDWREALDILVGLVGRQLGRVKSIFETVFGAFRTVLESLLGWIKDTATGLFEKAFDGFASAITNPLETVRDILETIIEKAEDAYQAAKKVTNVDLPDMPSVDVPDAPNVGVPNFHSGGFVESGGLANLQAGERVVPAEKVQDGGGGTTFEKIEIHANSREGGRAAGEEFLRVTKQHLG